ncbi:hypothetical protein BC833DRAFT_662797 [Globomyces pollinis-pini]|nr:hypothetical protein BC833DRAFT_662797 [Globomyces pollinis-pini]
MTQLCSNSGEFCVYTNSSRIALNDNVIFPASKEGSVDTTMNDHTYLLDLSYDGNLRYFDMSNKNALVWKSNSKPGFGPFTSSVSDTGLFGIYDSDNKLVWSYQWFDKTQIVWKTSDNGDWAIKCDSPGDDLQTVKSNSPQDCQTQCFNTGRCNSWALIGDTCYLKFKLNASRNTFKPASKADYCGLVKPKVLWNSSPEGDWGENCDWLGEFYKTVASSNPQDCQKQCFNDGNCNVWTLNAGQCYLKVRSNPSRNQFVPSDIGKTCGMVKPKIIWNSSAEGDWGEPCDWIGDYYKTSPSIGPQDCQKQCFNDGNCNVWTLNAGQCFFKVRANPSRNQFVPSDAGKICGMVKPKITWTASAEGDWGQNCDWYGDYYKMAGSSSPQDCQQQCFNDGNCNVWTLNAGQCYFKVRSNPSRNQFVPSDVGKTCGMVKPKVTWTASTEGDWGQNCDWYGDYYKTTGSSSPQDCQRQCFNDGNCNVWTLNAGQCYFKVRSNPSRNQFVPSDIGKTCGMVRAKVMWNTNSDGDWANNCDDLNHNDVRYVKPVGNAGDCARICNQNAVCSHWTWTADTTCYLKYVDGINRGALSLIWNPSQSIVCGISKITNPYPVSLMNCGNVNGQYLGCGVLCCSKYGFCGKTDEHCKAGCQTVFGRCNYAGNSFRNSVPRISGIQLQLQVFPVGGFVKQVGNFDTNIWIQFFPTTNECGSYQNIWNRKISVASQNRFFQSSFRILISQVLSSNVHGLKIA